MDDKFEKLNIEDFARDHHSFYSSVVEILQDAENNETLAYILPYVINQQYLYSDEKRKGFSRMLFLKETYLIEDISKLIPFVNSVIPEVLRWRRMPRYERDKYSKNLDGTILKFTELMFATTDSSVFNLEYHYSKTDQEIRRKLDKATIETVNVNLSSLEGGNNARYEEAVSEFLSYKKELINGKVHFYNDSLNNLKKVVENTLKNNYTKEDGNYPRLSNKKQISNILFDSANPELENTLDYIIKNIHHESGGQPKEFTEKEYIYLWLELNKILYLLNRYKQQHRTRRVN